MKYLLIASPSGSAGISSLLNAAQASSGLPEGVEPIGDRAWLVDAHKAFSFCAALVHSAPSHKIDLAVFRVDDDARLQ